MLLLTWRASEDYEKGVKTLNSGYSIRIIFFLLFRSGHFHNVLSTFTNVVRLDVENDSTLLDAVNFNDEIHNVVSTLI